MNDDTRRRRFAWAKVAEYLARKGPGAVAYVHSQKGPGAAGALRSIGLRGIGWRFPPDDACAGLHVYAGPAKHTWRAHLDRAHPACGVWRHIRVDVMGAK